MMGITRKEARMIAEEVMKLMNNDQPIKKGDLLTADEAASILKISVGRFRHISDQFPRTKIGRKWLYTRKGINDQLIKN